MPNGWVSFVVWGAAMSDAQQVALLGLAAVGAAFLVGATLAAAGALVTALAGWRP